MGWNGRLQRVAPQGRRHVQEELTTLGGRGSALQRLLRLYRAVASIRAHRFDEAAPDVEAAIALEPGAPEGYWLRSILRRTRGDISGSVADWATCLTHDPHFLTAATMREALLRVRCAVLTDPVLAAAGDPQATCLHSAVLRGIVKRRQRALAERHRALERPSCSLPCPSQCCYFDEEPFIFIEASKLAAVRACVRDHRLLEADYIGRTTADTCAGRLGDISPSAFLVEEGGETVAYHVRCDERRLRLDYAKRPRNLAFRPLTWLTPASRACRFAGDHGCRLHDVGDPPGLDTCRRFLCLTGFVFVLARDLNAVPQAALEARTIAELHEEAIGLIPLLDELYCGPEAASCLEAMSSSLVAAIDADHAGRSSDIRTAVAAYRSAAAGFARHRRRHVRVLRERLGG